VALQVGYRGNWSLHQAEIAGTALSTTSVAVVYAVMIYMRAKEASYTTLLMATGLTFGTISALFGLQNKIIDQTQYTMLVSTVILSAFVPTLIAQKMFQPILRTMNAWGRLYRRKVIHRSQPSLASDSTAQQTQA